jgi:hypothetical protein
VTDLDAAVMSVVRATVTDGQALVRSGDASVDSKGRV